MQTTQNLTYDIQGHKQGVEGVKIPPSVVLTIANKYINVIQNFNLGKNVFKNTFGGCAFPDFQLHPRLHQLWYNIILEELVL